LEHKDNWKFIRNAIKTRLVMSVIHISKRENPYVQIDKRVLEDPRLTWRSKGILAYLLSKPSGWKVNVKDIWNNGAEGRNAVQDCLVELQKIGYAKLITIPGEQGKLMGSQWQVTEEPIGGFPVNAERPKTGSPTNRKSGSRVHSNNESLSEINNNNEGERNTPAPNPLNLEAEKKDRGLVAPAENPETVKAEIPPSPNSAPPPSPIPGFQQWQKCFHCAGTGNNLDGSICVACLGTGGPQKLEDYPFGFCTTCKGMRTVNGRNGPMECPVCEGTGLGTGRTESESPTTHIVTEINPADPKTKLVSGINLLPSPRAQTTIEAEHMIATWIKGEGIETVKSRFNVAKQRFDPDNAAAIAAHYCSVYTKNQANKERLLKDPVTHFSDGLFGYLKTEESFGRSYGPKDGVATRQQGAQQTAQNLTSNMRQL